MKKSIFIALATTIAMGGFVSTASAKWTTTGANNIVAFESTTVKKAAVVVTPVAFTAVAADLITAVAPATFTLTASAGIFATGTTVADGAGTLVAGVGAVVPAAGIGTASVTWNAAAAATAGDIVTFSPTLDLNGVPAGTAINLTLTTKTAGGVILGTSVLTVDTAVATPKVAATVSTMLSHSQTLIADIADVATGFTTFKASGTTTAAASDLAVSSIATSVPAAAAKVLVTLSGNFTAIKSIAITGATGSTAAGVTTAVAGTTKGVNGQMWIDTVNGKAYAVATIAAGATTVTLAPTFTASGASIPAASYTADISLLADANYVAGAVGAAASPVLSITRNGAKFTSDNVSNTSLIRIAEHNATSAVPSLITYSAWDAAGAPVAQIGATLPTSVLHGHTVTIAKGVLKAAFPTAVRFNINVESSNVSITHFKQNAVGLNVIVGNVGGSATQL